MLGRVQPSQRCITEAFTFKLASRKWRQTWNGGRTPNALRRVRTPKGRVNAAVADSQRCITELTEAFRKKLASRNVAANVERLMHWEGSERKSERSHHSDASLKPSEKKKEFELASSEVKEVKELTHNLAEDWRHK